MALQLLIRTDARGKVIHPAMNRTEQIRELAATAGPCITIALAGNDLGDTVIEQKDAINAVRKQLESRHVDSGELLAPVLAAGAQARGGTVFLRAPDVMQIHRVPAVAPLVRVGERFDLRTILAVLDAQQAFYILALSQKRTRLLKCTRQTFEEIPFPAGFAVGLADAMQSRQPDSPKDTRTTGGPSEYLLHFFMDLEKGVNAVLKNATAPLIPVGVEHEVALYRRVNHYAHLVEPGIHGSPDALESGELQRRALEILDQRAQQPGLEVPSDFDKRVGTGHASLHIQEIVAAAYEGRASNLFFQPAATYMGTYDAVRRLVKRTDDPLDSPIDLIEAAGWQIIIQGGEAKLLPASAMPNGVPVCALFRYSAK
jgi:Bacterial archaeo-eukaryotic release factor family 3